MHADSDDPTPDDLTQDDGIDDAASAEGSPTIDDVNQSSFLDAPAPDASPEAVEVAETPAAPSSAPAPERAQAADDYVVLARKYRPQNFDELIGQEALVQTLTNAFKLDRVAHAFYSDRCARRR